MNIETIKFDEPDHINPFLTHWTGRGTIDNPCKSFEIIKKIIETCKFKLSLNPTGLIKKEDQERTKETGTYPFIQVRTICFTDTPIKQSKQNCRRYGFFGISFNKEKLIEYGANPVLYIVSNRRVHQNFLSSKLGLFLKNPEREFFDWFIEIIQDYESGEYAKDNWAEFYEREWRIIRPSKQYEKYFGEINKLFKGEIKIEKPNTKNESWYLDFDRSIIENIIVPKKFRDNAEKLIKDCNLECDLFLIGG